MKRRISCALLALVFTLLLGGNALAASAAEDDPATIKPEETTISGMGITATFEFEKTDPNKKGCINVTLTDATQTTLKDDTQYLVLMVDRDSKDSEDYTIDENSIRYIDQKTPTNGVLTFDVFPSSITNSVILICGTTAGTPVKLAIVDAKYIIGDADGDGKVLISDVVIMLQYLAGIGDASNGIVMDAANVDGQAGVTISDVVQLLQFLAGIITSL